MRALLFGLSILLGTAYASFCHADPGGASPDSVARAEQLFHDGTRAFEAAEYSRAYENLKAAWDLSPTYRTAAGLGQVELQTEQFRDAAFHLSFCLRHYPPDGDANIRAHVEEGLEQARTHVAALRVRVSVEGAQVAVDGVASGKSPLDGLLFVDPGSHTVAASREGYRSAEEKVETPVRATLDVSLSLVGEQNTGLPVASGSGAPLPTTLYEQPAASSGLSATAWVLIVGGSLTAAALATTVVFDVKGSDATNDLKTAQRSVSSRGCDNPTGGDVSACSRVHSLAGDRNTDNQIAILGAVVTGVLAAATIGTAIYENHREHAAKAAAKSPFVNFTAGPSGGSVLLGTSF
ncbi:MAG TPA: PEGA domain-containing protein [Polyangiaceae bacterium]|jgi:hypothetical protein|nr:PEGA domain-containing protein [Polyangiaceae bacterium]